MGNVETYGKGLESWEVMDVAGNAGYGVAMVVNVHEREPEWDGHADESRTRWLVADEDQLMMVLGIVHTQWMRKLTFGARRTVTGLRSTVGKQSMAYGLDQHTLTVQWTCVVENCGFDCEQHPDQDWRN